jgi:hypothetical protein
MMEVQRQKPTKFLVARKPTYQASEQRMEAIEKDVHEPNGINLLARKEVSNDRQIAILF